VDEASGREPQAFPENPRGISEEGRSPRQEPETTEKLPTVNLYDEATQKAFILTTM
jgi:hypothetical protein